jgi:hypothetical protein
LVHLRVRYPTRRKQTGCYYPIAAAPQRKQANGEDVITDIDQEMAEGVPVVAGCPLAAITMVQPARRSALIAR